MDRIILSGPEVYNLRSFRDSLPPKEARLKKALDRWIAAHSVRSDVAISHGYLEEALTLHKADATPYAPVALLHAAIVLYARALERHSDHRPAVRLGERFDSTQKAMHRKLISIRDDGLAHFGPTGPIRPLSEDFAVLIVEGQLRQPAIMSRRSLFDKPFADEVMAHFRDASAILQNLVEERRQRFQSAFDEAIERDFEELWPLVKSCDFDRSLLGSLADALLSQREAGHSTIIAHD